MKNSFLLLFLLVGVMVQAQKKKDKTSTINKPVERRVVKDISKGPADFDLALMDNLSMQPIWRRPHVSHRQSLPVLSVVNS